MRQYLELLRHIRAHGGKHDDRTQVGTTSWFGYQMRFDLQQGFPLLTTKRLGFNWIAQELYWFLSGSSHVGHLRQRGKSQPITIWDEWATESQCAQFGRPAGELGPIYGHCWRNYGASRNEEVVKPYWSERSHRWINYGYADDGFDQIAAILKALQLLGSKGRSSRRLLVFGMHPAEAETVALPACHTLWQLKWRQETNRLDLELYQRSADVFLGVPFNIASYALLLSILAELHGMIPGDFVHTFGDVHIYRNHEEQVDLQLSREPRQLPRLSLDIPESLKAAPSPFWGSAENELHQRRLRWISTLGLDGSPVARLEGYDPYPKIEAPVAI